MNSNQPTNQPARQTQADTDTPVHAMIKSANESEVGIFGFYSEAETI